MKRKASKFAFPKKLGLVLSLVSVVLLFVFLMKIKHFLDTPPIWEDHLKIAWLDLIPQSELELDKGLLMPTADLGSKKNSNYPQDFSFKTQRPLLEGSDYYQSVIDYDYQNVALPGFVVPLTYNDLGRVSSFFLVPYFGACINLPPPQSNQILYVTYSGGMQDVELYKPQWVAGELKVQQTRHKGVLSRYTMEAKFLKLYEQEGDYSTNIAADSTPESKSWRLLKQQAKLQEQILP